MPVETLPSKHTDGDTRFLDPKIIARVSNVELVARFIVQGFLIGLHKSPYHGFSSEFSSYRKYAKGDSFKFIDWKVAARTDVKGNWLRGRRLFFGAATCSTCHTIRGEGISFGPDLSNLVFRDRDSVMNDLSQPSSTINPL